MANGYIVNVFILVDNSGNCKIMLIVGDIVLNITTELFEVTYNMLR